MFFSLSLSLFNCIRITHVLFVSNSLITVRYGCWVCIRPCLFTSCVAILARAGGPAKSIPYYSLHCGGQKQLILCCALSKVDLSCKVYSPSTVGIFDIIREVWAWTSLFFSFFGFGIFQRIFIFMWEFRTISNTIEFIRYNISLQFVFWTSRKICNKTWRTPTTCRPAKPADG